MRILIAWEFGDNFGHLLRLLPIARALRDRGHAVLFAVKNVRIADALLREADFAFVQAPAMAVHVTLGREVSSFGDVLAAQGLADATIVDALIHAWQHLYQVYQPDVVLTDYAPIALFAARLLGLPTVNVATGFELPPPASPYPCFRPGLKLDPAVLLAIESAILTHLNACCVAANHPPLAQLSDMLTADVSLLLTLPEIDHYGPRAQARYLGPLLTTQAGLPVKWSTQHAHRVFVYLSQSRIAELILAQLQHYAADIICVVPGVSAERQARYQSDTLQIFDAPVQLDTLLPTCNVVISHAGHGLLANCVLSGTPMLVIPTHIEQMMLADCVVRMGTGLGLATPTLASDFLPALQRLLSEPQYAARAQHIAARYQDYQAGPVLRRIANTIEQLPAHKRALTRATRAR